MTTKPVYDIPVASTVVTTAPVSWPVTTAEAKSFARITVSDDDALVDDLISAAFYEILRTTGLATAQATFTATLDAFPPSRNEVWWNGTRTGALTELLTSDTAMRVPYGPLVSVGSVKYYDTASVESTFTDFYTVPEQNLIVPTTSWPTAVLRDYGAVRVTWTAGYTSANLPVDLKRAVLELVAHWYDARGLHGELSDLRIPESIRRTLDARRKHAA